MASGGLKMRKQGWVVIVLVVIAIICVIGLCVRENENKAEFEQKFEDYSGVSSDSTDSVSLDVTEDNVDENRERNYNITGYPYVYSVASSLDVINSVDYGANSVFIDLSRYGYFELIGGITLLCEDLELDVTKIERSVDTIFIDVAYNAYVAFEYEDCVFDCYQMQDGFIYINKTRK